MLYPAMSELLKNVDSRYLLVNVVAHRARQLSIESELTHEPLEEKPVTLAIREVDFLLLALADHTEKLGSFLGGRASDAFVCEDASHRPFFVGHNFAA